jgi:hypothetical protein
MFGTLSPIAFRDHCLRSPGQTVSGVQTTHEKETQMKKRNRFPKGWNEARVKAVLEHYEAQSEEEAVAEDEAAFRKREQTVMVVPKKLVPAITKLISTKSPHRATKAA